MMYQHVKSCQCSCTASAVASNLPYSLFFWIFSPPNLNLWSFPITHLCSTAGGGQQISCQRLVCSTGYHLGYGHLPSDRHGQASAACIVWVVCTWWGWQRVTGSGCSILCHSNWCQWCRKVVHMETMQHSFLFDICCPCFTADDAGVVNCQHHRNYYSSSSSSIIWNHT